MPRSLLAFSLALLVLLAQQQSASAEDLRVGARQPNDHLLERLKLTSAYASPTAHLDYKKIFTGDGTAKITELKIQDLADGCATVIPINGGPGSTFVVLHVTAPKNCYAEYIVELYGQ